MITPRRIICSILSAILIASCSMLGPDTPQRVVRIKTLADVSFRARNQRWADEARGLIEAASDYYEREFNFRLVTQGVSAWTEKERIPSTPDLLAGLQKEFSGQSKNHYFYNVIAST